MNFSHILATSNFRGKALVDFGFSESDGKFVLERKVSGDSMIARISVSGAEVAVQCFDINTGERYALLDVPRSRGAFTANLRQEISDIMEEIRKNCFSGGDISGEYRKAVEAEFGVRGDFPWENGKFDGRDYEVFRKPSGKWFALIMEIGFKKLRIQSDEKIRVVNLKAESDEIGRIVDGMTVFPAYHMSKRHWITVVLSERTGLSRALELTRRSYELVVG